MDEIKVVDIGRLSKAVAGRITLDDGTTHDVLKATGRTIQSIRAARGADSSTAMFEAVRKCVPSLPAEAELDLTMEQATMVFGIATAGVAAVEAMFPNEPRPDADPTSPA
jgi:hypothetical protein